MIWWDIEGSQCLMTHKSHTQTRKKMIMSWKEMMFAYFLSVHLEPSSLECINYSAQKWNYLVMGDRKLRLKLKPSGCELLSHREKKRQFLWFFFFNIHSGVFLTWHLFSFPWWPSSTCADLQQKQAHPRSHLAINPTNNGLACRPPGIDHVNNFLGPIGCSAAWQRCYLCCCDLPQSLPVFRALGPRTLDGG